MGTNTYKLSKQFNPIQIRWDLNANSSYIISIRGDILLSEYYLYIYCLSSYPGAITIKVSISSMITSVEMHPNYKNIFLSTSENEIKIWEINEKEKICQEKINVKAHQKFINKALFCRNNDKHFLSYSKDNTIKIWSMESSFCLTSISVNKQIKNIEFYKEHLFYQEGNESIVIYNPIQLIKINTINIKLEKFFVIYKKSNHFPNKYFYDFIIFDENNLILNSEKDKKISFKEKPEKIFYDNNYEIMYIFLNSYLKVIKTQKMEIILNLENRYIPNYYLGNKINDKFICGNFLCMNNVIKIYSFYSKEIYNSEKVKVLTNSNSDFWNNCIPIISEMKMLSWENNIKIPENDFIKKNYLNDENIKEEIFSNFNKNLKQKCFEVKNKIKSFIINKNDLETNYKEFIRMLIKDNTNKDLILKYLDYLRQFENHIKYKFIVKFKDEFNYYKIMFEDEELLKYHFDLKGNSEKVLFFNLLDSITKIDIQGDLLKNKCFQNIEETLKNIQMFNQPIKFDNKELYWHRNCFIIYSSLQKIKSLKNSEKRKETLKICAKLY